MHSNAILIGNSDGIGLAMTRRLLKAGWDITGVSKSESLLSGIRYHHYIADVSDSGYPQLLAELNRESTFDLCVYFAGIGELLNPLDMSNEPRIIDINLTGMVRTAAGVVPGMVKRRQGHFMGISSMADELLSAEAPSYHASKAGFSSYLGGLALSLKHVGVYVTNVRFGFVDTKMAKGDFKPFMMGVEKAVDCLEYCIKKRPASYTAPKAMIPLIKLRKLVMKFGAK